MLLSKYPRVKLANLPTPIEKLERLSKYFGNVNLYVKRDDETGLAGGGNKVRKLEYLIGDAIANGADTIITQGAVQSNHVRQTVAAASKMGLRSRAILERRISGTNERFDVTGNVLLDHLLGVESLRFVAADTNMNAEMEKEAEIVRASGGKPYIIPGGGSNAIGALGYVNAAIEIVSQVSATDLVLDHVVVTSGSSGTHAGLAAGFAALHTNVDLLGISIRQPESFQVKKILDEANKISEFLGVPAVSPELVKVNSDYVGGGYGVTTPETLEAITLAAQYEGLLLDPVYTGKAFAGLVGLIRKNYFKKGANILFIHTGGNFGLFAYEDEIMEYLASSKKNASKKAV